MVVMDYYDELNYFFSDSIPNREEFIDAKIVKKYFPQGKNITNYDHEIFYENIEFVLNQFGAYKIFNSIDLTTEIICL